MKCDFGRRGPPSGIRRRLMYGFTAPPWIGPGLTIATWMVMSSSVLGWVARSDAICARLSIWKTPVVSALRIASKVGGSSKRDPREVDPLSRRRSAISSTHRSTAESIPRPSRSILRNPASAQESLSHWTIRLPGIADGITGQHSISGWVATIIPPECWEMWRGRPVGLGGQPGQPVASVRCRPPESPGRWRCRRRPSCPTSPPMP